MKARRLARLFEERLEGASGALHLLMLLGQGLVFARVARECLLGLRQLGTQERLPPLGRRKLREQRRVPCRLSAGGALLAALHALSAQLAECGGHAHTEEQLLDLFGLCTQLVQLFLRTRVPKRRDLELDRERAALYHPQHRLAFRLIPMQAHLHREPVLLLAQQPAQREAAHDEGGELCLLADAHALRGVSLHMHRRFGRLLELKSHLRRGEAT